jgi:hypothetical protein
MSAKWETMYYNRAGQPISIDEFSWDIENRRIGADYVVCGDESVRVSTVHLGLDHSWGDGPPLIFETMLFGGPESIDQWQRRYSTEEQARAGIEAAVDALRRGDLAWFEDEADNW